MSQGFQDFIFAMLMLAAGFLICVLGAYSTFRRKLYYNPLDNSVATEIDVPILGKLKTNAPAIALSFIGLVPMVVAAHYQMQARDLALVKIHGRVAIDPSIVAGVQNIMVGATSSQWTQTITPNAENPTVGMDMEVPEIWKTYTFYAVAFGGTQARVVIGGVSDDKTFDLRIAP